MMQCECTRVTNPDFPEALPNFILCDQCRAVAELRPATAVETCYVAGPYRSATTWQIDSNIQSARAAGACIAKAGLYPVIPHTNTAHFDGLCPDRFFLDGTLRLLSQCDCLYVMPTWRISNGTRDEIKQAISEKKRIFWDVSHARDYVLARRLRTVKYKGPCPMCGGELIPWMDSNQGQPPGCTCHNNPPCRACSSDLLWCCQCEEIYEGREKFIPAAW
jgi:hypothetical protein